MKKILVSLICIGLLTGSMVSAITPKRLAQCAFKPKENQCTKEERETTLKWFIGVPAAVVAAALALLGIKLTADQVKKAQENKKQQIVESQQAIVKFQENPAFKSEAQRLMEKAQQVNLSEEIGIF